MIRSTNQFAGMPYVRQLQQIGLKLVRNQQRQTQPTYSQNILKFQRDDNLFYKQHYFALLSFVCGTRHAPKVFRVWDARARCWTSLEQKKKEENPPLLLPLQEGRSLFPKVAFKLGQRPPQPMEEKTRVAADSPSSLAFSPRIEFFLLRLRPPSLSLSAAG